MGFKSWVWVAACMAASTQCVAQDTVQASWREIKVEFPFLSQTTGYLCHRVKRKVQQVLELAGAHPQTKVRVTGCHFETPTANLYFAIDTAIPVLARPRPKSEAAAPANGPWGVDPFPATWKQINLAKERNANLQPGDCELVRILATHVFSQMTVTVESDPGSCMKGGKRLHMTDFNITALVPVVSQDG